MDTTIFLAQIWGPILLAVGLGIFISRNYYLKIYRELEKNTLAVLVFGIASMAVGIAQIGIHNVWSTLPEIIISILGWGTLVKGIMFLIVPNFVDKAGDWEAKSSFVSVGGIFLIVVGAYLTWFAYLA